MNRSSADGFPASLGVSAHSVSMSRLLTTRRSVTWLAVVVAGASRSAPGCISAGWRMTRNVTDLRGKDAGALFGVALPDTSDREQSIGQWKGKVVIVNFWATWCVPCREEMPEFVKAQREFGGRGLQFVGIAVDDPAKVREFATELGLNYPALIGGYGAHRTLEVARKSAWRTAVYRRRRPVRARQSYPVGAHQRRSTEIHHRSTALIRAVNELKLRDR